MPFAEVQGIYAILIYTAVSYFVAYAYIFRFLQVEDEVVEAMDVFKENWALGFFNFMFAWVITYNCVKYL